MKNKVNLKVLDILNKKFSVDLSGYSAREVDQFLDQVLEDYRYYEELINEQKKTIDERVFDIKNKDSKIERLEIELKNAREQVNKKKAIIK